MQILRIKNLLSQRRITLKYPFGFCDSVCSASLCLILHLIAVTTRCKMCLVAQFINYYFGANFFNLRKSPTALLFSGSVRVNQIALFCTLEFYTKICCLFSSIYSELHIYLANCRGLSIACATTLLCSNWSL